MKNLQHNNPTIGAQEFPLVDKASDDVYIYTIAKNLSIVGVCFEIDLEDGTYYLDSGYQTSIGLYKDGSPDQILKNRGAYYFNKDTGESADWEDSSILWWPVKSVQYPYPLMTWVIVPESTYGFAFYYENKDLVPHEFFIMRTVDGVLTMSYNPVDSSYDDNAIFLLIPKKEDGSYHKLYGRDNIKVLSIDFIPYTEFPYKPNISIGDDVKNSFILKVFLQKSN